MQDVEFVDRKTGKKIVERVPGGGMMRFLYSQNILGRFILWAIVKRRILSVVIGWYMLNPLSAKTARKFVTKHNLDLSDYQVPEGGFKHFNRFFYRKIKTGSRPIGDGIISPADGKILVFPTIDSSNEFYIKGEKFNLNKFFQSDAMAEKYNDGAMAVIRLAPTDYHRFHFPVSGYVLQNQRLEGMYYSVSPLALKRNMRIFWQNKRHFVSVETEDLGEVAIAEVGATLTGSIVQSHWPNIDVEKGDEKGYFAFGGSTVIVFFEKSAMKFSDDLLANTNFGLETAVKMGETIGEPLNG
ncbi:MAG: archaetidylserine decarboxylase [Crocinitomicaceae bacterium]